MSSALRGLLALAALAYLLTMLSRGGPPPREQFVAYEAAGVLRAAPPEVATLVMELDGRRHVLRRVEDGWQDDVAGVLATPIVARLEAALDYLHAVRPVRELAAAEQGAAADYGLASPRLHLEVGLAAGRSMAFDFGDPAPTGAQQYLRLAGDERLYLLSSFVGEEWAAVARALAAGGP